MLLRLDFLSVYSSLFSLLEYTCLDMHIDFGHEKFS